MPDQCVHLLDYIPITVVEYDDIRSRQIDAEASSANCEQDDELLIARFVVFVNPADTIVRCGPSIRQYSVRIKANQ